MNMEKETKAYLNGYREGFESALKISWALAEELLIKVPNIAKDDVRDLIKKLSA